ncbi:cyclic peptide export ABC transporter [Nitrospira moscoviensis]|nr:cyclic peptide export ABC transporter [Nitrospira moscoviensis]
MIGSSSLGSLHTLLRRHRGVLVLVLAAGGLSGLFSAAVVAVINRLLHPHDGQLVLLTAGFAGLVTGKVAANLLSQLWLVRFAQDAVMDVTMSLCRRIVGSSLRALERAGADEVFTTLTDDVGSVVWAAQCVPNLAMNGAMVAGCGVYLLWLSPGAFLGVAGITAAGAAGYYWLHRKSFSAIRASRDAKSRTFQQFRGLTSGVKELLMNAERARRFVERDVRDAMATLRRCNLTAFQHHLAGESWTQSLYYLLIGIILVVFPSFLALPPESLTGFVFAMLYLMNPVWSIIGSFPAVSRGRIALARIEALGMSLEANEADSKGMASSQPAAAPYPMIAMEGVTFAYEPTGDQQGFTLGPLDFVIRPGELVFIVGGNGSGKSTFVKLLTGLYRPDRGTVRIGGVPVTDENRAWYRQHFSAVFSDYHLFEGLHIADSHMADEVVQQYLNWLELEGKVTVADGRFSTVNLSQGQRRRLALLTAYLEDRPVYVFDEWAADQDPHYKGVFYNRLLPDLSARGKAIVVITHDDRYYHVGDRVVKLEDGRIVKTWSPRIVHAHLGGSESG